MIRSNVPITPDKVEEAKDIIAAMSLVKNEVIDPDTGAVISRSSGSILPADYDMANKKVDAEALKKATKKDAEEITEAANAYWKDVLGKDIKVGGKMSDTSDMEIKVGKRPDEDDFMSRMAAATAKNANKFRRNRETEEQE